MDKISGGISNLLVKVTPPAPLKPVAVKVFGAKTELIIDRDAELQLLLHLNKHGFGPQVNSLGTLGPGCSCYQHQHQHHHQCRPTTITTNVDLPSSSPMPHHLSCSRPVCSAARTAHYNNDPLQFHATSGGLSPLRSSPCVSILPTGAGGFRKWPH